MTMTAFRLTAGLIVAGIGTVTPTAGRSRVQATEEEESAGSSGR